MLNILKGVKFAQDDSTGDVYAVDCVDGPKKLTGGSSGGGSAPKPLTYDYMPEGYPTKAMETGTLMEEQELSFSIDSTGRYRTPIENALEIIEGQTYIAHWDGTEYECVCSVFDTVPLFGNLSIFGMGDDTGEPFMYVEGEFITLDTSASHTIRVKGMKVTVTPIAEEFLPTGVTASIDNAQTAANNAQTAADNAQTAADAAEVTANNAKATADAALPKSGGEVSGIIKSSSRIEFPRKYSSNSLPIDGLRISSNVASKVLTNWLRSEGIDIALSNYIETIVTYLDGIIIYNPTTLANGKPVTISAEGERLDFISDIGKKPITISAKDIILQSSTADSTKKFKITVDDSGTISATEVT